MSYSPKRVAPSSSTTETKSKSKPKDSSDDKKKKKILTIAIIAVLCVVIAVSLLFIFAPADGSFLGIPGAGILSRNDDGGSINYTPETQGETTNISAYYDNGVLPTAADRHDISLRANGGADASDLYGTWVAEQGTTYIFDGQGKGVMLTGKDQSDSFTFDYSAENGRLGIDMDTVSGNDFEYDYTVDGDTLTLTRDGYSFTLKKSDDQ